MAAMTDERRKEMEEEMSRFELEICGPKDSLPSAKAPGKPLAPPPAPPKIPPSLNKVITKPPVASTPRVSSPLLPPPPPPALPVNNIPQFVPHQLNRQHPRPHMPPHHMNMHPQPPMGMDPYMGNFEPMPPPMPMNLPLPPGFCPPGPHHGRPNPQFMNKVPPPMSYNQPMGSDSAPPVNSSPVVAAAPTVYSAPFVKSQKETVPVIKPEVVSSPSFTSSELSSIMKAYSLPVAAGPTVPPPVVEEVAAVPKKKKKKIVRMAGGQAWEDNSLLEWETDDFRIFCGDLGNDVTDEVLIRAFSRYPSFVKAKVIRDKRTNKTKGFGFVSFKDPQDFIKAMREMNGRYVGSRPIKLRKSSWRDRNIDVVKKKQREKEKLGLL